MHHEGKGGLKGLGGKQLLYLRKKRASATASEDGAQDGYHLREEVTLELDFMKQTDRMSGGFEKIWKLSMWRGQTHPKRKKEIVHGVRARNLGAPTTQDSFAPPKEKWIIVRT